MSKKVIELLNKGILPDELNFRDKPIEPIDWAKVKYNTFYKSPEFYENKFPEGFENLPGFDKIINQMVINGKLPLDEMLERQSKINEE
jgi:hypothetical protein